MQNEVAAYLNIDRTTYSRYEENILDAYPMDKLKKAAELFDVELKYLLDDYNSFLYKDQGRQIKKLRKRLGLTQSQLAKCLNVGLGTLKKWEQNKVNMQKHNYLKLLAYMKK